MGNTESRGRVRDRGTTTFAILRWRNVNRFGIGGGGAVSHYIRQQAFRIESAASRQRSIPYWATNSAISLCPSSNGSGFDSLVLGGSVDAPDCSSNTLAIAYPNSAIIPFHSSKGLGCDALPLEVWWMIMGFLPREIVWRFRTVCASLLYYIEHDISKSWFTGSRLVIIGKGNDRVWRIEEVPGGFPPTPRPTAFPCIGYDDSYLSFVLFERSYTNRPDQVVPYPPWLLEIFDLDCIPLMFDAPDYHVEPPAHLYGASRPEVIQGALKQGFKFDVRDGPEEQETRLMLIDRRVLFSSLYQAPHGKSLSEGLEEAPPEWSRESLVWGSWQPEVTF